MQLATTIFGNLEGRTALIVGAGETAELTLPAKIIFNRRYRTGYQRVDRLHPNLLTRFVDVQNFLLNFVQQFLHVAFVVINFAHHAGASRDEFPQKIFFADDVEIITQVRRARHRVL